jgi:hypothetical protein
VARAVGSNQPNPPGQYGRGNPKGTGSKAGKPMTTDPMEYVNTKGADKRNTPFSGVPESAKRDGDEVNPAYDWWPQPQGGSRPGAVRRITDAIARAGKTFPDIGPKVGTVEATTPHDPKTALRNGKKPQGLRNKPSGPLP